MKTLIFILCMFNLHVSGQTIVDTCTIKVPEFKPYRKGLSVEFSNGYSKWISHSRPVRYVDWYYYAGSRFKMWEVKKVYKGFPRGWDVSVRPLNIPRGKYTQHMKPLTLTQKFENFLSRKK